MRANRSDRTDRDDPNDRAADSVFDLPPRFALVERRRSGLAEAAWSGAGQNSVPGFESYSVIVDDPGGRAMLVSVGSAVGEIFGLVAELPLERRDAFTAELCAACELVALHGQPLHFEATLAAPGLACILLRGVALPLANGDHVQIVLSWREVLNRAATARLRRDFVDALRQKPVILRQSDPFSDDAGRLPPA